MSVVRLVEVPALSLCATDIVRSIPRCFNLLSKSHANYLRDQLPQLKYPSVHRDPAIFQVFFINAFNEDRKGGQVKKKKKIEYTVPTGKILLIDMPTFPSTTMRAALS